MPEIASSTLSPSWTLEEVRRIYQQPLLPLIEQAHDVHRQTYPKPEVQLCRLLSIKTGGCPEDCAYCPQSARHETEVDATRLMSNDEVVAIARKAKEEGSTRFCMGAAWRQVKDGPEFDRVLDMIRSVADLGLEVCCTLGMLTEAQAHRLAEAGLTAYNHNLDTSPEYYGQIITTRTYEDRLRTLECVRNAGITVCCGGIIGMGESDEDRIRMLHVLATMKKPPESVPINALVPVEGTPLAGRPPVHVFEFVRAIATARILMPQSKVRLSAGRLSLSPEAQALCFYAGANSIFVGDKLLTTPNPGYNDDHELLRTLGLLPEAAYSSPDTVRNAAPPAQPETPAVQEPLELALERELKQLEAQTRLRRLRAPLGEDFCSNDYLGLARHPQVRDALAKALAAGIDLGSTGSRLVRGDHPAFTELEEKFAAFRGTEAALYFSSGFAANTAVLSTLIGRNDVVFSDELNHASLIDGLRLAGAQRVLVPHLDVEALEQAMQQHKAAGRRFLVVESVYSMEGDRAPLQSLVDLCRREQVELIVDEAHATGLFGPNGEGLLAEKGLGKAALVSIHPCGKALGAAGALVACSSVVREYLVNRARPFIYSTAPSPLAAVQLSAALDIVRSEPQRREQVFTLARSLRSMLQQAGLAVGTPRTAKPAVSKDGFLPLMKVGCSSVETTCDARVPIIPVRLGRDEVAVAVAQELEAEGFDVRAIRPPTVPEGTARLRVTVHAGQTQPQIDRFAATLVAAVKKHEGRQECRG